MERSLFRIIKCEENGFEWKLEWKVEGSRLYLSTICRFLDILTRFEDSEKTQKLMTTFQYDVKSIEKSGCLGGNFEKVSQLEQKIKTLKNVEKEKRLEKLYDYLDELEFLIGISWFCEGINHLYLKGDKDFKVFCDLLYRRYKVFIVLDQLETSQVIQNESLIFCAISSQHSSLYLTDYEKDTLFLSQPTLDFPYTHTNNWKDLLPNFSSIKKPLNNPKLIDLLVSVLLESGLTGEEEENLIKNYQSSGLICKDLDLFILQREIAVQPVCFQNFPLKQLRSKCDKCHRNLKSNLIQCDSHSLCLSCRKESFTLAYSNYCSYCNREYSLEDLTILCS